MNYINQNIIMNIPWLPLDIISNTISDLIISSPSTIIGGKNDRSSTKFDLLVINSYRFIITNRLDPNHQYITPREHIKILFKIIDSYETKIRKETNDKNRLTLFSGLLERIKPVLLYDDDDTKIDEIVEHDTPKKPPQPPQTQTQTPPPPPQTPPPPPPPPPPPQRPQQLRIIINNYVPVVDSQIGGGKLNKNYNNIIEKTFMYMFFVEHHCSRFRKINELRNYYNVCIGNMHKLHKDYSKNTGDFKVYTGILKNQFYKNSIDKEFNNFFIRIKPALHKNNFDINIKSMKIKKNESELLKSMKPKM